MTSYGMFFSGGSKNEFKINDRRADAPWIQKLKDIFNDDDLKGVNPYARQGTTFNIMSNDVDECARIYFIGDKDKNDYRVFGFCKGEGKGKNPTTIIEESKFKYDNSSNDTPIKAFINFVEKDGCVNQREYAELKKLCKELLKKLI